MSVSIRRERFDDPRLVRFSESVDEAFRARNAPFLQGALVKLEAQSAAGVVRVAHKLGAIPRGFFVVEMTRAAATTSDISLYQRTGETMTSTEMDVYTTGGWDSCSLWVY